MKYLQLFESTHHPWTGEPRLFFILWNADGSIADSGSGHPKADQYDDRVVKLKPVLHIKIKDFERTITEATSPQPQG